MYSETTMKPGYAIYIKTAPDSELYRMSSFSASAYRLANDEFFDFAKAYLHVSLVDERYGEVVEEYTHNQILNSWIYS